VADFGVNGNSIGNYLQGRLKNLVNQIQIPIRVAHYPAYCSKYNPIEHRLFPHVSRACRGVIFKSIGLVKQLISQTQTKSGLQVIVDIIDKVYQTGRKVASTFKQNLPIVFDESLPKWNYTVIPQSQNAEVI
jgi:hypothetical protein